MIPTAQAAPMGLGGRAELEWHIRWEDASVRAATQGTPLLVFAILPNDGFSRLMDERVWKHPEVRDLMSRFALVRLDVEAQAESAERLEISATPSILLFAPDGRELQRLVGVSRPEAVAGAMRAALAGKAGTLAPSVFDALEAGRAPAPSAWPELLAALGGAPKRAEKIARILALRPFPATNLVAQLNHPRLAVRTGALDILEQAAGADFGLDPWETPSADTPSPALAQWQRWAEGVRDGLPAFSAFTAEQVRRLIADRIGPDADRSRRAGTALAQGGPAVATALEAYLENTPNLGPGAVRLLRETRYTLLLPSRGSADSASLAKSLVYGTPVVLARTVRELGSLGEAALPVAREHLTHTSGLVREAAVDAVLKIGGKSVLPELGGLVDTEKDREVLVSMARGLASVRTKAALGLLTRLLKHADEDVVITALASIAKLKSATAAAADVTALLADGRWRVRASAITTAAEISATVESARLEPLLSDPDSFVRYQAIQALPVLLSDKKAATKRLEALFHSANELKLPVLATLLEAEIELPASIPAALAGAGPDILLPVVSQLSKAGKHGLPLAFALRRHANPDVAVGALKCLAANGMEDRRYRAEIVAILGGSDPVRRKAVLNALDGNDLNPDRYRSGPSEEEKMAALLAEAGGANHPLRDLFVAFGLEKATSAGLPELFAAFGVAGGAPAQAAGPADPSAGATLAQVIDALRALIADPDPATAIQASMVLLLSGRKDGFERLQNSLPSLTVTQSTQLAYALRNVKTKESVDMLVTLVGYADAGVREYAADSLANRLDDPRAFPLLVDGLLAQPPRLKPESIAPELRTKLRDRSVSRPAAHAQLARLWTDPARTDLVVLGLFCASGAWSTDLREPVEKFSKSPDPLVRRAALQCLVGADTARAAEHRATAAADTHPQVRAVALHQAGSSTPYWHVHFAPGRSISHYEYQSGSSDKKKELLPLARKLATDSSADVRLPALLALLEFKDPLDAEALMSAIRESSNPEHAEQIAANALDNHIESLDARHAALLPLVEHRYFQESKREDARRRLTPPETTVASAAAQALRPGTVVSTNAPVAEAVMRVVLFHTPGCEDCERTRGFLKNLQATFPGWTLEEQDIHQPAAAEFNRLLCLHFQIPTQRGKTPSVFMSGGGLSGPDLTVERLTTLANQSFGVPFPDVSKAGELAP